MTDRVRRAIEIADRRRTLLHACLDDGDAALAAWERWRTLIDFDLIDNNEQQMIPLAHSRLKDEIADDPVAGRVAGIYRRGWTRNQVVLKGCGDAVGTLTAAGIRSAVLDGLAIALINETGLAVRPIERAELLVAPADAARAIEILAASGWSSPPDPSKALAGHGVAELTRGDGTRIGIHEFSLWSATPDGPLWDETRPLTVGATDALAPSPADLLLAVFARGASAPGPGQSVWAMNAALVLRSEEIDWDRLTSEASRRRFTTSAAASLAYLRDEFGFAIPDSVVEDLASADAPAWERREFITISAGKPGPRRTAAILWLRHRRMKRLGAGARQQGFLSRAGAHWGFEKPWELPFFAARKLVGRPK